MTATIAPHQSTTTTTVTRKGWHTDPEAKHDLRFHDGNDWTEHVTHFGPVPCQGCNSTRI